MLELTLYHADLIEALGLESPHIVGHYSGAMVAAEMAAIRAVDMGKLVLAAPAGFWQDDNPGRDYNTIPAIDIRQALFADPDSEAALSMYPVPKDDEELGWQIIHRVQSLSTIGKFLWPIPDKGLGSVDISTTLQWLYVKCHHTSRTMAEDHRIPAGMS